MCNNSFIKLYNCYVQYKTYRNTPLLLCMFMTSKTLHCYCARSALLTHGLAYVQQLFYQTICLLSKYALYNLSKLPIASVHVDD